MSRLAYIPRLDGVRAVAIAFVLVEHLWSWGSWGGKDPFGLGRLGVRLFFVLSGFLITRILLAHRDSGQSATAAATQFYWRRILRLSPPYYLAIAAALTLGLGNIAVAWPTDITYLANLRVILQGHWDGSSHFWSLSVEEQFYILWFVVVIILPRRCLLPTIWSAILIAPLFRMAVLAFGGGIIAAYVLLPGAMDALASGALLAVLAQTRWPRQLGAPWLMVSSLSLMVVSLLGGAWVRSVVLPSTVNLASLSVIAACAYGPQRKSLGWLGWRPVAHLGRISYGLYIYHYFMPQLVSKYLPVIRLSNLYRFVFLVVISIGMAEVSWWLIERPILKLKDRVPRLQRALAPTQT